MPWEVVRRGLAIGVFGGVVAGAEIVGVTPALHAPAAAGAALLLTGIAVCVYGAIGLGIGLAVAALGGLGRCVGLPAVARLGSARALWPLAIGWALFAALNEAARRIALLDTWRQPGRIVVIGLAAVALLHALWRPAPVSRRERAVERALAWGAVPAAVCLLLYAARPFPVLRGDDANGGVLALAPRFAPEPPEAFATGSGVERTRVLLIGIDGASWDRIASGVRAGRLPTFARLLASGVHAPLRSLEPTHSPRLWTSIVTGVPPADHGIESFYLLQLPRLGLQDLRLFRSMSPLRAALDHSGELRFVPVTSSLRRRKAIWNLADEAGLASAVLGLWATWPPEPLRNGVVVSDHASLARRQEWLDRGKTRGPSGDTTTWPPELAATLAPLQRGPGSVTRAELAEFVDLDAETWAAFETTRRFSKQEPLSAFRSSHLNDAYFASAAARLWAEREPDLLVLYLRAVDELSHFFYEAGVPEASALGWSEADARRYGPVVDRAYAWTDRAMAPLVDAALQSGDTLIAVVSDHGWEREPSGRYNHNDAPPGLLLLAGAGVCTNDCPALVSPSLYDIAPTLLTRLGLPLSDELAGRPLDEAFRAPRRAAHVARYGAPRGGANPVASGADPLLREKLEALGYLDR